MSSSSSPTFEEPWWNSVKELPRKRNWKELHHAVKQTRALQQGFVNRIPHSFTFNKDKLYFLAIPKGSRENTLHYVDLPERETLEANSIADLSVPKWNPVLDAFKISPFAGFSREEQLLRERKRLGSFGITSYEFDQSSQKFLFPASNGLYTCSDLPAASQEPSEKPVVIPDRQPIIPEEIRSQAPESKMDAKLCPCDSNLVAFIHRNDLWVHNLLTGEERRLTYTNGGSPNMVDEPVSAGVPSFVVQEEFDRYTGYWWQPKCEIDEDLTKTYKILYEEVDESVVEVLHIVSSPDGFGLNAVDSYRYPRAGSLNAKSTLKIVEFHVDAMGKLCDDIHCIKYKMKIPLEEAIPITEYLVRCGWLPDGNSIWAQVVDRRQQHTVIVQIPLAFFVQMSLSANHLVHPDSMPMIRVLAEDTTDIWINVADIMHFLQPTNQKIQFIWSSEASAGFRHLFLATVSDSFVETGVHSLVQNCVHYPLVTQRQLTAGHWKVDSKQIWVNEERNLVYFMGTKDTPIEQHLYVVSYAENCNQEISRLTSPGRNHVVALNEDCSRFVTVFSSINESHSVMVCDLMHNNSQVGGVPLVSVNPVACLLHSEVVSTDYHCPELFSYRSKYGHEVHGFIFKPPNMKPGVRYPTVLFVYGGPHVQLVTNSHKGTRYLRLHTISTLGYVVVTLDGRGSAHRGLQLEGHIKDRMGQVEIEDQVEGLQYAASVTNFIDMSRVAIHGWSYGGYLSLFGLIQRPDIFKIAIAGAPVTTWEAYDTGYTERYMNTPQENPVGYKLGSVLNFVDKFPDEENRVLIVHGLIDENVHFYHTSLLINALVKECKPYQLLVYPNERHGIRQTVSSEHYETALLSFLQRNL